MPGIWIEKHGKNYRCVWQAGDGATRQRQNCGPFKDIAKQFADKKWLELFAGATGVANFDQKRTWAEYIDKIHLPHRQSHNKAPKTVQADSEAAKTFSEMFENVPLNAITSRHIEEWKTAELKRTSVNSVRIRLTHLKVAFSHAHKNKFTRENPAKQIQKPAELDVARVLSESEFKRFLGSMRDDVRRAVMFALYTGCRLGEVIALDWRMIHRPKKGLWEVVIQRAGAVGAAGGFQPKNRQPKVIPLHQAAKAAMGTLRAEGRVFADLTKSVIESPIRKARVKAGVGRVRFHDLRHTWATTFMRQIRDPYLLQKIGGWRSPVSTARYQHYTSAGGEAMMRLNFGKLSLNSPPQMPFMREH